MLLRYTLITDGSSDRTLLPILGWLCETLLNMPATGEWFDPRIFAPPSLSLKDSVIRSIELFPCDVLFIHRDAEGFAAEERYTEIADAIALVAEHGSHIPYICVVPVRMTEAWLLFDEKAIRKAAGNPNGKMKLTLPRIKTIERIPDPKNLLFCAIKTASGLNSRRLKKLDVKRCRFRVAESISDFSPLRALSAFSRLEQDIRLFFEN